MICSSLITGCSDTYSDTESYSGYSSESVEDNNSESESVYGDQAGAVIYVGDYYLEIASYIYLYEMVDYTSIEVSDFTSSGYVSYVLFDEYTEYYRVKNGELISASLDDITENAFIIEMYTDENLQQIIIIEESSEAEGCNTIYIYPGES